MELEPLHILLLLITAAVLLLEVAQRLNIPYPIVLIIGGALISFLPGTQNIYFDPNLLLLVVLPPILYYTAFWISNREFKKNLREIVSLALGLVVATSIVVACLFKFFFPEMPWALAFVFGGLIAPPDATAAKATLKRFSLPPKVSNILEAESLINDATGIVLYKISLIALASGGFSLMQVGDDFFRNVIGGLSIGLATGYCMQYFSRYFLSPIVGVVFSFTIPYVTYLIADWFQVSGVLAVVTNALIGSQMVIAYHLSQRRVLAFASWDIFYILLNCFVFVLIGVQLQQITAEMSRHEIILYTLYAFIFTAAMIVVRFIWIYLYKWGFDWRQKSVFTHSIAFKEGTIMGWSSMRGIVSLALALALPYNLPDHGREIILLLTFEIILLTLVITGLSLPFVIKKLKIPLADTESTVLQETRKKLREVATKEIEQMDTMESHKKFLNSYFFTHHTILELAHKHDFSQLENSRLQVIEAQKKYLLELWKNEQIDDHELAHLQQELDLEITHIARGEI